MFRAYDPDQDKLVAVKLFRLDLPPERVHQLVAELERLVAEDLTHAALAAPLAAGMAGVHAYLAQDFVAAEALDIVVREHGAAPVAEALRVITQLAGALDYAAVVNIVHGALHPRDVLISPDDVRLTGVGVARALEKVGVALPVRRPFTAPERAAGGPWDRRADVFSLAVLAHELLWARRLAATGAEAAASLSDLPGARLDALRDVFARALAEDPAKRFVTALDFAEALKGTFQQSTIEPRLPLVAEPVPVTVGDAIAAAEAAADDEDDGTLPSPAEPLNEVDVVVRPPVEATAAPDDIQLRAAEEERFVDVETAPAAAPPRLNGPDEPIGVTGLEGPRAAVASGAQEEPAVAVIEPERRKGPAAREGREGPREVELRGEPFMQRDHPARSAVWPLALAVAIGVAVGFAGGYALGRSERENGRAMQQAERTMPAAAETEVQLKPDGPSAAVAPAPPPSAAAAPAASVAPPGPPAAIEPAPAPAKPAPAPAAPARNGRLTVRSTPAGARVFVDGRDVGRTPTTVRNLARGQHTVRVARDGYTTQERRVSVTAAQPSPTLSVRLPRAPAPAARSASLMVESRPTGATVFVDGKRIGTTPLSIAALSIGAHAVRLELKGFRPWTASVSVVAGEKNRVAASLEP